MTHCAKCGAELIGSRKFCIACGAPTIDPRNTGTLPSAYAPLSDRASSSSNASRAQSEPPKELKYEHDSLGQERTSDYGPPPTPHLVAAATDRSSSASTSQTLMSARLPSSIMNAASNRRRTSSPPPREAQPAAPAAATHIMEAPPTPAAASSHPNNGPNAAFHKRSTLPMPVFTPQTRQSQRTPHSSSVAAQTSGQTSGLASGLASGPNSYSHHPPQGMPAPVPSNYASYNMGFAPGTRVQVAWADGRTYPAMVQHANGAVYLVMFPDGRQVWIDRQYLAPV